MKGSSGLSIVLIVALVLAIGSPVSAGGTDLLMSAKLHGALALTASGVLLKEAYDARKDANSNYDQYRIATSTQLASELYDESKRNDTRSLLLLGGGLGSFALAIHLFMSGNDDDLPLPELNKGIVQVKGIAVDIKGDPILGKLQVNLMKGF